MANIVYCKFCGQQISFVRSNQPAKAVTAWMPIPVNWSTTPAPSLGTTFNQSAGHVPHARTCPFARKWARRAGSVKGIVTRPDNIGTI
ncbi:MAG: hypothetical protein IT377_12190 [Polyangiaceae bacterium]|nr:hypothetical protein [Polyangiaceae bacterium]